MNPAIKHHLILCSTAVLAFAGFASESAGQTADNRAPATQTTPVANAPSPAAKQKVAEEYGKLPLSFEANHGQTDPQVKFLSRGPGYKLFLLPHEAVLTVQKARHAKPPRKLGAMPGFPETPEREASAAETIRMSLLGAAPNAEISGVEQMPGKSNYFIGNDPAQWRTNVPNYAKVQYHGVYPGIDLIYHGSRQQLEYDFVVAPGADPRQIRLALKGAKKLELTREGDLLLATSGEPVRLYKPVMYQDFAGKHHTIDGSFVLTAKNTVKFRIGKYDATQPLIIDPVLAYSTLLGGNGFDEVFGIAVDSTGSAYVTGTTTSTNFATTGAPKTCGTPPGTFPCDTAFVAKLNFSGNTLSLGYVTYLGGTGFNQGSGVAVSALGNAYVTGRTDAVDFPTLGAFQSALKGSINAFVTELDPAGSALVFSTYLGGSGSEFTDLNGGTPIAVDTNGNAYVTGITTSGDFPTVNAFQSSSGGGAFRSTDGSATWIASPSGLTSPNITVFAVDPTVPTTHIVYAGTSEKGLFKSTNSAQSWTPTNGSGLTALGTSSINSLVLDHLTPTNVYVGSFNGVFKSTDGGATWAAVNTGLVIPNSTFVADVQTLAIDPKTTGTAAVLYAGGFNGAFKTVDAGAHWTSLNAGFPLTNGFPTTPDVTSIVVDPTNPNTVYTGTSFQGVFKTTNGGINWMHADTGLTFVNSTSFFDIGALAVDANSPNHNVYATTRNGVGIYKTANGGVSWSAVNTGLTDLETTGITSDPSVLDTLYVGTTSSGVFKTTDGGLHWTTSTNPLNALANYIVTAGAVDPVNPANLYAGSSVERPFVTKFLGPPAAPGTVGYSTYLGGHSQEFAGGIAVDSNGQAHVTGSTESRDYPTTTPGAFRTARQSIFDAYVTKLSANGSALVYSTYLDNPNGFSEGFGIAVDAAGSAYVTGVAGATFPTTAGAFQTVNPADNAFVTKLSPDGTALVYSTFLGGPGGGGGFAFDEGRGIAVDAKGNPWVTGITEDINFPTVNPIRASTPCEPTLTSSCFFFSPFVSEISPDGKSLLFSTYFGPTAFFAQGGIALDAQGNAYIAGTTSFAELPMVNALPPPQVGSHGFVAKIAAAGASTDLSITLSHSPDPVMIGQNITFTSVITNSNPAGGATATGVTFYPTQVPNSTIHLFKTLAPPNPPALPTNPTATQGACDSNEFCSIGSLAPGASATVTMVVTTFAGQEGTQTVAVGVGGNESDPTPANNFATTTVNVLGAVDLHLNGTASPAPVILGGNLTYTLLVNNNGPSNATGVKLTDTLPAGVTFVSATPTQGTPCTGTPTVVCALGTVPVGGSATVTIVVTPTAANVGTITNASMVTANETITNPGRAILRQVSDVVAGVGAANPNNLKLNGHYAFLFQGATPDALMAFAGSFVADGSGNLTSGISDTNLSAISGGVLTNQAFTGTYNIGADNRGTMTITTTGTGGTTLTFRFALGALNSNNVATKARFIEFDASGRHGSGVIEMQDPAALANASNATINGSFAFGASGEDANASHFAAAGRFTADGLGNITGGLEDADTAGFVSPSLTFTGTYNLPAGSQNGRGTFVDTFTGNPTPVNGAFYVISANELFSINTDPRSASGALSSGQLLKQRTAAFSNAWLNGTGVFNLSGALPSTGTDVVVGVATTDGAGNITVLSDENNAGVLTLNHTGGTTAYNVASTGRTTFTGGTNNPILYLVDLNRGFLVATDANAGTGSLEPQSPGPFSNASISGNYFFGDLATAALGGSSGAGVATSDGLGNLSATQDQDKPPFLLDDSAASFTYLVSSNGRTIFTGSGGNDNSIIYLVSPAKAFVMNSGGNSNSNLTVVEGSALPTGSADLAITKSASVSQAEIGTQFVYNLSVKNNGPGLATGVVVTDALPGTVTLSLASASQGACSTSTPVVCSLGTIPNGGIVDISILVTAASAGSALNSAAVTANETDPNTANNSTSSAPVTISSAPDLTVFTTATPDSVILGANLTFTATVINVGNQPASSVTLTDTLPAGVTFVSATPPPGAVCTPAPPTVSCPIGGLAANSSFSVTIVVTPKLTGTITNTATATLKEIDPTPGDNSASASATVLPSAGTSERYILTDFNSPTVLEYDVATSTLQGSTHAGTNPEGIAISPNGRLAFVGNVNSNYISVIDLTINAEIARIRGVRAARHLALNSDGTRLVVPTIGADEVDIIDTSNFQILKRVSLNGLIGDDPNNPNDIGLTSVVTAGNFAYINNNGANNGLLTRVAVIDLTTFAVTTVPGTEVNVAGVRDHIAATPDGKWVVVTRRFPAALEIIDTSRNTVSQTLNLATAPSGIVITRNANDPNGVFGYLTQAGNTVSVVDFRPGSATFGQLIKGAQITLIDNIFNGGIGISADGNRVVVTSVRTAAAHNVIVLDTQQLRGPTPGNSVVTQFHAGGPLAIIDNVDMGLVESQPPANAPVVSSVNPASIVNDAARQVHVTGSGFAPGALVRVGSLDPIAPSTNTPTDLLITLPQFMPAQNSADVIVTNPSVAGGGAAAQETSGISRGALTITNGNAFQPLNEVTVSAEGDNSIAILNNATRSVTSVPASPGPFGQAISADSLRSYVGSFRGDAVDVINLNTRTLQTTVPLAADTFVIGQIDAIVTAPNPATGGSAEFLLTGYTNATTGVQDLRVVLIDSDPTSSKFNTIVGSFAAGLTTGPFPGALAVTSDGHFAYANDANTGNLVIFNIQSGAVTVVPVSALANAAFFQAHLELSPDNKSLILVSNTGSLLVFDVGANPISPALVTTITGTPPAGLQPLFLGTFHVVGKRLYAFDGTQGVVQAINFDRAAANFSPLGSFTIPGITDFFASGFAVTPDGALIYAALDQDDSVAVIDVAQLLTSSSTALITKFHTGLTPSAIIVSPGQALVANLSITKTATPSTVAQGTTVTFTITVTNSGPASSTGVIFTDPLPAGMTFVSATPSQGTCNGTTTISCSLGNLAVGASATASIVATATSVGSFVNTATVSENETNPSTKTSASANITVTNTSVCPTGTTIQWTGLAAPADGQWTTAANWNPTRVPLATDDVCIDTQFAGTTVTLANSAQSVHSLISAANFALNFTSLTLAANSSFLNTLALTGTLNGSATVTINGLLTAGGGTLGANGSGTYVANGGITSTGGIFAVGGTLTNNGPAVFPSTSAIRLTTATTVVNNSAGATLTLNGSSIQPTFTGGGPVVNNAGTLTSTGASSIGVHLANSGNVVVSNGTLSLSAVYTQNAGATEILNNGSSITTTSPFSVLGGLLEGTGTITGSVNVAGGIISPGFSPGTIGVVGIYSQTALGTYNAEIGGLTAGTQYDQITGPSTGTAQLNGTLNVTLINGFVPVAGNTFTLLTCSGTALCVTGKFSALNLPTLPNGLGWSITYNLSSVVLTVVGAPSADLAVAKTANVSTVAAGGPTFSYLITVTNNGPSVATGVTLTDVLPAGVAFFSAVANQGACTGTTTITCALGTLANSASTQVAILVNPVTAGAVVNTATVTSNVADPVTTNNSSSATVQITSPATADLALTKTGAPNPVTVGANLTYTLKVTNNGPSSASNVTLTDTLPTGPTFVSAASTQGTCSGTTTVTCNLGSLANAAPAATVTIIVKPTAVGSITNNASVTATETDPNTANNTASATTTVSNAAGCGSGGNQWTGSAADNQWGTPSNWASGAVPIATDNACIGTAFSGSTITVGSLATANQSIASLTSSATITVTTGPLTVTGAAAFANALNITGGTLNLNGASTVQGATNLTGGTLSGSGNVTLTGLLTWKAGPMSGTGTTTANGGIAVGFFAGSPTLGRTLSNNGTATFNANPLPFSIVSGGTFINSSGSTMDIQTDGVSLGNGGNKGTITNMGTIVKSGGTGGSSIDVNLNSTGPIQVNSGTLTIDTVNGLTSATISGTTTVAANATLNFNAVTAAVSGGVSGAGSVSASGGTVTFTGVYNISGTTTLPIGGTTLNFNGPGATLGPLTVLNGSVVNFNAPGTITGIGAVTISGSTANFASSTTNVNIASLHVTQGGVLTGANNLTIAGASTLNQGTISGAGTITANGPVAFNVPPFNFPLVLDGRTFTANAGVTMTSTAPVQLQNGAIFVNSAASLFDIQGPAGISFGGGIASAFNNFGVLQRSTGTGSVPVAVALNNSGTVSVNAGTLAFSGGYTQTLATSSTQLNGGSITSNTGLNINGGKLGGTGSITGNVSVNNGAILSPGFGPGTISLAGNYTQTATGSYLAEIAGPTAGTLYDQLNLTGTGAATLGGTLTVSLLNGFVPVTGNSFTILTCAATTPCINGTFASTIFPTLPGGLNWNITYNPTSVVLSIGAAVGADLSITKTASVATTNIGSGNFTYLLVVKNNGPTNATGLTITDPLPANVTPVTVASTADNCILGTTITCTKATLASGASFNTTITVAPAAVGTATNTATVTANEADPNTGNNSASATVQIQASADLSITKTAQPNPVNAGSPLTYTLRVTNNGPNDATGVTITDPLPAGVTFVSATPAGVCSGTTTVTCAIGNLAFDNSATITLVVTPTGSGQLSNTATVSATTFDPSNINNASTAVVTVNPVADLAVTETASPNPDGVGQPLTFTITIANNGPSPATGVTLSNPLPGNTTFVSAKPSQGTCTAAVSCAIGNLAKGATATVTLVLNPTAVGTVTNVANVSANETDPVSANNSATTSVPIQQSSDLALIETVNSPIPLGANLTYTFTVTNNGPSVASGITLTDTLPANVTFVGTNAPAGISCSPPAAGTFTCSIVGLAVNAAAAINVVVKPNATGNFVNSGAVASGFDPNPANNTATATGVVNASADLSVQVSAPQSGLVGVEVGFTYTITNSGPSTATGVTLTDTLPAGLTFVRAGGTTCTGAPALTCSVGNITSGSFQAITLVVKPSAAGNFTNTANVSATEPDPFPSNNTAINSFTAVASADLAVAVSASPNPAAVGVNLTFTTTVTNNGPSPATGVVLAGTFTTGGTFVSLTPSQGTCQGSTQFSCSIGSLPSGSVATVTAVFTPTAAGQFGTNEAVTANEPDPNTANNSTNLSVSVSSAPVVTLSTPSLNFASEPVGTQSTAQSITLQNTSAALALISLKIVASGDFAQTNNCGTGLAALASCNILVTFQPTGTGTRNGAITITDNGVGSPQSVSLTGIGINAPAITLAPGSLVFSSQRVGVSSSPLSVTLTNTGNATLNITSIAITGTNAADFSQTNTCGPTLAPTISCTISVVFKPTGGGQRTAGVAITSDARGSVPVVTLSGTGISPGLDLSTSLLVFTNQAVGSTSAEQTVTVSNAAASAVAITSITPSGDFAQTNTCGNSVAANGSCAILVTFTPTGTGTRPGTITLVAADSTTPHVVNLSGTGVVVTLSLSPASLTFGDQKVGTSSQAQSITLTNTSGAALTITSIVPSGDFLEADTCGNSVAAGASCSINVTFTPTATGARPGTITITSNAQGSPHTAKLTGNGVATAPAVSLSCSTGSGSGSIIRAKFATAAAAAACTTLTFPGQAQSTQSAAQTVVVSNVGNAALNVTGASASGDFAATNLCTAPVAPGASCNITVTFTPTTTGSRVGLLSIQDNAGDSPQSLSLTGTGTPNGPSISLSATALPFGNQLVGSTSSSQSLMLTNSGNAKLTFTGGIKPSGDFAFATNSCTDSLAAGASCNITVTFTPTATGPRAGAITITDDAPGSPQSVTLSGEGTDIIISVPPGGSTSATITAGQSATFPLTFSPSGGFSESVTVSCVGTIPAGTCTSLPGSFTLNAPVTVTTTVTTHKPSNAMLLPPAPVGPLGQGRLPRNLDALRVLVQALLAFAALLLFVLAARRRRASWLVATAALFLIALVSGVSGCAGGSGNPGIIGPTTGTPTGTYTVTVVVKTASGATRTQVLTITVH